MKGLERASVNEHLHAYRDIRRMNVEWKNMEERKIDNHHWKNEQTNDNAKEEPGQ